MDLNQLLFIFWINNLSNCDQLQIPVTFGSFVWRATKIRRFKAQWPYEGCTRPDLN